MVNQVHTELNAEQLQPRRSDRMSKRPGSLQEFSPGSPYGISPQDRAHPCAAIGREGWRAAAAGPSRRSGDPGSPPAERHVPKEQTKGGCAAVHPPRASTGHPISYQTLGAGHQLTLRPCRRGRAGGATGPCRRRRQRSLAKAPGADSPALDHPGASLPKSPRRWAGDALTAQGAGAVAGTPRGPGVPQRLGARTGSHADPHGPAGRATAKLAALELPHACAKCPGPTSVKCFRF